MINLEVRKAQLPYFKPYMVVDIDTKKVLAHCDTEKKAQKKLTELMLDDEGEKSLIQSTDDPMTAHQQRLENPCGATEKKKPIRKAGHLGRRKVVLDDDLAG
jgi:hypothetical protein